MLARNWKHQWLQLCLAKLVRKTSMERPVARLMISSLHLRVSWKSTSTQPWGNPEQGSQDTSKPSHELLMYPRAKVDPGSGKHSVYTYFPKDPNCDICLKTKITRASCRRRAGTVVPRAEKFGDLITADHKILSEESEPRNNHRYAVVVQDLATQWLQSYPCKTKTSQETQRRA